MTYTAFANDRVVARGDAATVAAAIADHPGALVFDDETGRQTDLPREPAPAKRGRPALGVVAREVTLLPRHWDWLASRPDGVSAALRRLVDEARRQDDGARARQDAAYHFLMAIAGDRPGYEDALRALYAGDRAGLEAAMAPWPPAVSGHALRLASGLWQRRRPGGGLRAFL